MEKQVKSYRENIRYFDYAATCFMPDCVIDKWVEVNKKCGVSIGRGNSVLTQMAENYLGEAEDILYGFFGASNNYEMFYTKNVTESINIISLAMTKMLKPLDIILVAPYEHHSNYLPWKRLAAETGALFFETPVDETGAIDLNYIRKYKERIKIMALSSVSNSFGYAIDIATILDCLSNDTIVAVDESQLVGHGKIYNDNRITIHFLASHKMYGPKNIAGVLAKRDFLDKIDPIYLGGGMVERVGYESEWKEGRGKFMAGTLDVSAISAWAEACKFLSDISFTAIEIQEKQYMNRITDSIGKSRNIIVGDRSKCCNHIITFYNEQIHAHDVNELFNKNGIVIRTGNLCAQNAIRKINNNAVNRISLGIGLTDDDVEYLCKVLEEM